MKQRLSLLLVFALVLSLFAGCGSQGTPEPQPATPAPEDTPAATATTAALLKPHRQAWRKWKKPDCNTAMPTLRGNTYVQDAGQMLYVKQDNFGIDAETTMATADAALMETCVREYMGDATGTVIILE